MPWKVNVVNIRRVRRAPRACWDSEPYSPVPRSFQKARHPIPKHKLLCARDDVLLRIAPQRFQRTQSDGSVCVQGGRGACRPQFKLERGIDGHSCGALDEIQAILLQRKRAGEEAERISSTRYRTDEYPGVPRRRLPLLLSTK